jgi:hypothetical protein
MSAVTFLKRSRRNLTPADGVAGYQQGAADLAERLDDGQVFRRMAVAGFNRQGSWILEPQLSPGVLRVAIRPRNRPPGVAPDEPCFGVVWIGSSRSVASVQPRFTVISQGFGGNPARWRLRAANRLFCIATRHEKLSVHYLGFQLFAAVLD